jgi:hypothetical protein
VTRIGARSGADKAYDTYGLVEVLRQLKVTPACCAESEAPG